jgi:putative secretion ATPase (PEP-CTERM system associated)
MYEAFYGLSSHPFQLNPDPSFYYGSKQHRRAKAYLEYGVSRNEGFIVITGEIGAGKTTVLRGLLNSLEQTNIITGHLVTTQLDAEDTLRMVAAAFGFRAPSGSKAELLSSLEAFLLSHARQGKRCLLVVDEAQNLTPRAVEELRMLSNFQLGNHSLLQSFLVGQPEFREILQRPEMEQFRQRVSATCHIGPLDREETQAYILHRLKCAGSKGVPEFEPAAFPAIHTASHGIPRRINSICDRLLLLGYMENRKLLTSTDVDTVLRDFADEVTTASKSSRPALNGNGMTALHGAAGGASALGVDISLPLPVIDGKAGEEMVRRLGEIDFRQVDGRLLRLELSLMRLEGLSVQTVRTLQELVNALTRSRDDTAP